jgi:glycosyltransferase involved in cell wall biosynthesis
MRIGVDATCWANGRGYGRFTRQLVPAMAALAPDDEFVCLLDAAAAERFDLETPNVRPVVVALDEAPTRAAAAWGYRSPRDLLRLTRAVWRERPGVFFSPSVYTYFPLPPGQRAVVTVHDAIAERFPRLTLPTRRARLFWTIKVRLAIRQARLVLTVSDFAARELVEVLGVPPERIRVAGEAPAPAFRPSGSAEEIGAAARRVGLEPGARWFIYVGGFNPHKHVDAVVRAHARLVREAAGPPVHLLLVGTVDGDVFHGDQARIREAIRREGTEALVHWTGFVPDEDLRHLHSGAVALVLPSACEGFGLPAVEAAACGTPVVATTASPLPRLLDGGGFFVRPGDEAGLTEAMRALLADPALRARMGRAAAARAAVLDWARGARAALAALREAAA